MIIIFISFFHIHTNAKIIRDYHFNKNNGMVNSFIRLDWSSENPYQT